MEKCKVRQYVTYNVGQLFLIYLLYGSHLMLFLRIGVVCPDEAVKPRHAYSLSQTIA
jgi:hypothetical protein